MYIRGVVAQRLEQPAHNRPIASSNLAHTIGIKQHK